MKIMLFGTFDIIHEGHKNLFKQAKDLAIGSELIIVLARDQTIKKLKRNPINNEKIRKENLKHYGKVLLGDLDDPYKIIEELKPDIIALGYDQTFYTKQLPEELIARNLKAKIIRLKAHHPEKYKSSLLRKNLK